MNCPNHPDVAADQVCSSCGKSFCKDCVIEIGGQILCAPCKEEKIRDMKSGTGGPDLASPWARLGAMLVDGIVFLPVTLALFYYFTFVKGDTTIFQDFVPRMLLPAVLWSTSGKCSRMEGRPWARRRSASRWSRRTAAS